ncbi:hypothetical protein GCM10018779_25320 [Streptomyces griseocarneus]|nr:hypothetical protein GCM10018779_25320 [Streptomyces griseocarneus]
MFVPAVRPLSWVSVGRRRCGHRYAARAISHTGVNAGEVIHRQSEFFPTVDEGVDNCPASSGPSFTGAAPGRGPGALRSVRDGPYFHCVETTNPAAMKPKPTTMFQLRREWIGMSPLVT